MSGASSGEGGISVLIPAYNPDIQDIKEILTTLTNQTYQNFEIIIANDGDDFYSYIQDIVAFCTVPFQYKKNEKRLGLYPSIKENVKYCRYENILVLEQDIIPLSRNYIGSLIELLQSCPGCVVTSRLMIDVKTNYKKYVFYKRRISDLGTIDHSLATDELSSNEPVDVEVTFTKADLLSKSILGELFSAGSTNSNTAQDIILSSIVRKNRRLVTSDATACEVAFNEPNNLDFFLKKEYLYGKSVFDAWRHSDKDTLKSTSYFKEKIHRVLFVTAESAAIIFYFFELLVDGALQLPLLITVFGLGILYTQAILARIAFWSFWRKSRRRLTEIISSSVYIILLDVAWALGILRRLLYSKNG